ncbi:MAG: SRPBCC domain-containing protein [Chloroflexi bacterium]|nr:SRPBCC domain-containing protein [Chloroflexota bacterium]
MIGRSVSHGTFSIERIYPAPPERVFAAWAIRPEKNRWFGEGDDFLSSTDEYTLDFQVGGRERLAGTLPGGRAFTYDAIYQDIVDGRRIVSSYDVAIDGRRTSVSLMTIEIDPAGDGTRLILTEQGAYFDGLDSSPQREEGALDSLTKLGLYLDRQMSPIA